MVNNSWKTKCASLPPSNEQIVPHDFERLQWQKSPRVSLAYLIYKWCVAIQFVIILIWSIFHSERYKKTNITYWKWFIYLTNWGYTLCMIQSILSLWIVQSAWMNKASLKDGRTCIPKHYKIYWILHTTATDVALTVTFLYWCTVHNPEIHQLDAINVFVHAGNSFFMLIDLCLVKHTTTITHGIYGIITGLTYSLFSFIYYSCGGTDRNNKSYIYEVMDWRYPSKAVIFSAISVGVVTVAHAISWTISWLRRWIAHYRSMSKTPPNSPLALQEKPIITDII